MVDAARRFIQRSLGLNQLFTIERRRILGPGGTQVLASEAASAFGLLGHWWVMDELAQWNDTSSARAYYAAIPLESPRPATPHKR